MLEKIALIAQNAIRITNKEEKVLYFDPFKISKEYVSDADYIFITHSHFDHFSPEDILKIKKETTKIIAPIDLRDEIESLGITNYLLVTPNQEYMADDIKFSTVPAYNTNKNFHKKEYNWVGYVVVVDDEIIYVAGDTDNTKEAQAVKCDIALVPIGGTYTMTAVEVVELIKVMKPKIAIPTHYGSVVGSKKDAQKFKELLEGIVEVQILM